MEGLPWAKDVTVKNVVKHTSTLIALIEAKSMGKRKHGTGDESVRSGSFCLDDILRDCLESSYCHDDDVQDSLSQYFNVGGEQSVKQ